MSKIQLNESLFEAVNSIGRVRPDTYKKRQKPISILVFDSLETLGYNVYANSRGNGYEISKKYEKNLQKAKDLCDALNLDYIVRPFRDRFYMTINLPREDENTINKYFKSTDKVMAERITSRRGSNKLNKYLKENNNTLSIEDKFDYLKSYPTYDSSSGLAYTRPCKVYDLGLTDEQEEKFFTWLEDEQLSDFWMNNDELSQDIYQSGRMGGHLVLDPEVLNPKDFEDTTVEELFDDYLYNNYYISNKEEADPRELEEATEDFNKLIDNAYNTLVDFDNRVDQLIENLKMELDGYVTDIDNLDESFYKENYKYGGYVVYTLTLVDDNGNTYTEQDSIPDTEFNNNPNLDPVEYLQEYYDDRIIEISAGEHINESFEDEHLGEITTAETIPETPAVGPELGIAGIINSLIIDEWEAIDGYNSAIATAEQEGMTDIVNVLKDIVNEEMNHVGMLETALSTISPNIQTIKDGEVEASDILKQ